MAATPQPSAPLVLSVGLKQFSQRRSAERWLKRQTENRPCFRREEFSINETAPDCFEVEYLIRGLNVPPHGRVEIQLFNFFQ